jgi:catechol 2,3-dioxygenase-like lactoylglutathione lyase family enzyme
MLKGNAHIAFVVENMEESLRFYCEVLGFEKAFDLADDQGKPWINYLRIRNGQYIELFYGGTRAYEPNPMNAGSTHVCFEVDDIFEIAERLKKNGVTLTAEPKRGKDFNYQCWTKDPDGNPIEFMQLDPRSPQSNS